MVGFGALLRQYADLGFLLLPPLAGGVIGYFTNDLAIRMLFRPYRPLYLGNWRLPFTPGLIPANQSRLGRRIADQIMASLLTPEELHRLAQRLLAVERLQQGITWLLGFVLGELRRARSSGDLETLARLLEQLAGRSLQRLLRLAAQRPDLLAPQLDRIFDAVLLELRVEAEPARQLSDWILEGLIPPPVLRQALVDFLTDRNIAVIDRALREKTQGTYWIVANLVGARSTLEQLRQYSLQAPAQSEALIAEMLRTLEIRERLQRWLRAFQLAQLPAATQRDLRRAFREAVLSGAGQYGQDWLQRAETALDWQAIARYLLGRLDRAALADPGFAGLSRSLAELIDRYLEAELETIVAEAMPVLRIDEVIVARIEATSPADLEAAIQGIVRQELQAIVNLGGLLGVVIGALQSLLQLWRP